MSLEQPRFYSGWIAQTFCLIATYSLILTGYPSEVSGQSVCLPAPRLLTTMPMGGKAGSKVEITISGEYIEDADGLYFSDPRIVAKPRLTDAGHPVPDKYMVEIASDCPPGLHEARVMTRLGVSSSRIFSVGTLSELSQSQPNTTLATAQLLPMNSICNSVMSVRSIDHYAFDGRKGQRVVVDCATRGIDSKLDAVVIIADAKGRDLLVERRGGVLDFNVPEDGRYVIKVHELTFKGGPAYFYRLAIWEQPSGTPIARLPSTKSVNSFSWPPVGLKEVADTTEIEPNSDRLKAQKITLPCDISGSFFPAADVDIFEVEAKKGDVWWVEVASERFGRPTDPSILVQHVNRTESGEVLTDVVELSDIPSPVKVSSNGYAYDGPPYNAGTSDILGKLVILQDGLHRLQLTDLYGGTRSDSRNIYRLVIRKAAPDFAVVAWALHMELRNGDRNALSKPISLRGGSTMALEIVAIRRDGFDGEIEFAMEGLPEGVVAHGMKIPAGQSRGMMLITAKQDAPRALVSARFFAKARIGEALVTRPCHLASMSWPIPDAWGEVPSPRLLTDVPVSVSGFEYAPITISSTAKGPLEARVGEKLVIPLLHTRRSEFSGSTMQLKSIGAGFERVPAFDISLTTDNSQATLDLANLKTPPGDYVIAFYGSAVAKYRHRPDVVLLVQELKRKAEQELALLEAELKMATEVAKNAPVEKKEEAGKALESISARHKAAVAAVASAGEQLKKATQTAEPRDIVDIIVSEPIALRVLAAENK